MHPASPGIGKPVLRSAHKRVGLFRAIPARGAKRIRVRAGHRRPAVRSWERSADDDWTGLQRRLLMVAVIFGAPCAIALAYLAFLRE